MKIIDFRFRPPYKDFIKEGQTIYDPKWSVAFAAQYGAKIPQSAREKSMELALREMDENNIVKAVVPIRVCQGGDNREMATLFTEYPNRFIGMAGLVTQYDGAVSQSIDFIDEFILDGPYHGAFMEPGFGYNGSYGVHKGAHFADDEALFPIYEKCQKHNISLLISYGGFTSPDHSYNDPIHIDHVAAAFPDLKIILAHAAWPYSQEACFMAMLRKNVYLSPDLYMINSPGQQDYIMGANYRLRDKILFGTAYPVIEIDMAVNYYKEILREEVQEDIFYHNAARALGLSES